MPVSAGSAPRRVGMGWRSLLAGLGGSVGGGTLLTLGSAALPSPWLALAVPVALVGLVVLMLSPSLSFLLTSLVVPVERLGRLTDDSAMYTISLMRIVGTITLASRLLTALLRRQRLHFGSAFWVYLLYLGIALTGLFHSTHMRAPCGICGAILGDLLFSSSPSTWGARIGWRATLSRSGCSRPPWPASTPSSPGTSGPALRTPRSAPPTRASPPCSTDGSEWEAFDTCTCHWPDLALGRLRHEPHNLAAAVSVLLQQPP